MFERRYPDDFHLNRHRNGRMPTERERYLAFADCRGPFPIDLEGRSRTCSIAWQSAFHSMMQQSRQRRLKLLPSSGALRSAAARATGTTWRDGLSSTRPTGCDSWAVCRCRVIKQAFATELDAFLRFEEQERGFAPATIVRVKHSLSRCSLTGLPVGTRRCARLRPKTSPRYISTMSGQRRWKRTTIVAFMSRHCATSYALRSRGAGAQRDLVDTIDAPRIYELEGLPQGPQWNDVKRLLAASSGDSPERHSRSTPCCCSLPSMGFAAVKCGISAWTTSTGNRK